MSEVGPHTESPALGDAAGYESLSEAVTSRSQTPQGQHEGVESSTDIVSTTDSVGGDETGSEVAQEEPSPVSADGDNSDNAKAPASKQATLKTKSTLASRPPTGKTNGTPPTPPAKKMINSGPSGSASMRTITSKPAAAGTTAKPSVARKPTLSSSIPSKPSATPQPGPPSRRASIVPPKSAAATTKPTLSSSTSSKPPSSASATRASVVSPTGSTTSSVSRPRAAVSVEGIKRAPLKPSAPTSGATAPPKPPVRSGTLVSSRTNPSISSIREVKEDGKAIEALQAKLKEVSESLQVKSESITKLEEQVAALSGSLESAQADLESKRALVEQLGSEKLSLEKHLDETKAALQNLESRQQNGDSGLTSLKEELEAAKTSAAEYAELEEKLRARIQVLEEQVALSKEALAALQDTASSDAKAASAEREALLKAEADLAAASAETAALKLAQAQALQEAQTKIASLEAKTTTVDDFNAQIANLKTEKEETANKLSELEVEILELKETLENVEDERDQSAANVKNLEEQLATANAATQKVIEDAKTQAADFASQLESLQNAHKDELKVASDDHAKVVASLDALKFELENVIAAKGVIEAETLAAAEAHVRKLEEVGQAHAQKETELLEQIKNITATLESQEAIYQSKVDAVKAEHNQLLQEAFERAKHEAGSEHAQELQALRAGSSGTIEQIQTANQAALADLRAEHEASLNSEVARLEKTISTLKLDLKATQDDLAKAKSGLELSRAEVQNLITQRDEALASISTSTDASTAQEEAIRLTRELANTKDDLAAITDMLNLTKASLAELSNNHSRKLEEAAQIRAEEVTKLRGSHDEEVTALVSEKSALLMKLSDLEGELLTLKATVAAEPLSPRGTGNGGAPSSPGVTREELQRMHEAHNLKIYDLQAEHQKTIKVLRDELEASSGKMVELQQEVDRKAMEIQYLEQDQEESQEQITRLREELNSLTERRNTQPV